jgi:B-box zinc finger
MIGYRTGEHCSTEQERPDSNSSQPVRAMSTTHLRAPFWKPTEEFNMLRLLRKTFGTIALVWLALWLLTLIAFGVAPKAVGAAFSYLIFLNYVGAPASLIWAVVKVISVLKASRSEPPVSLVPSDPPDPIPAGRVWRPERAVPLPETPRIYSSSSNPPSEPEVYTYSAPGMPICPRCGERPAIFHCLTHRQALCLQCVAKHDEPQCVYVPAFRAPKPGEGQASIETLKRFELS